MTPLLGKGTKVTTTQHAHTLAVRVLTLVLYDTVRTASFKTGRGEPHRARGFYVIIYPNPSTTAKPTGGTVARPGATRPAPENRAERRP